ncbi:MAG: tetratricopeptide repeat protein [Deltaproteobacteria bacterium]|nr:tetratricopeptide repeat protein [Deltaproteobacteria bacterium]
MPTYQSSHGARPIEVQLKSSKNQKKSKQIASSHQESRSGRGVATTAANHLLPVSLLVLLCLIVYYNSLSNGFVYDDLGLIVENKYIKQPGRLIASLFNGSYFQFAGLEASYRPVATLSYFLIYAIAELNPFYYHLASLILHTLNAILVYWLANLILQHRLRALMAGLLFACHPVLSEAVNCIAFNDDLLTAFFFMLALIFYIRIKSEDLISNIRGYFLTLFFYILGLLSKEMAITLPAIVLLYDLVLRDVDRRALNIKHLLNIVRKRIFFYIGYMTVSLIYIGIRFFVLYNPRESLKAPAGSLFERIIYLPDHIFSFIKLTIYPGNLNADYVYSHPSSFFEIWNLIGVAVVLALVGFAFLIHRYSKEIFFGIWWFLITLFPVYNLIQIYHPLAERYLYLPIIGFCLVVPVAVNAAAKRHFTKPSAVNVVTLIPIAVILSLYSAATITRNPVWQNNFVLWSKTVQSSPNSLVARGGLGMAYLEQGMLDEAAEQFELSINLYPGHAKSYYNLGLVYHQKGDQEKALENFKRSVEINPESMRAHYNLATIYLKQGLWDRAIHHYVKVNELDPEIAMAHYNLGMAYAMQGKLNPAVSEWEKVLQLDPHHTMAKNNIQKAEKMMNRTGGKVPNG